MDHDQFVAMEGIEYDASVDLYEAAPDGFRESHALEIHATGGATCLTSRGIEPASIFRRAVGLGVGRPATRSSLEEVLAHMDARRQRYVVPVAPHAQPPELSTWLESRGFTQGYAWMKFHRPCLPPPEAPTDLDVRVVGREHGAAFGKVVAEGFGLVPSVAQWVSEIPGRESWICVMAFAGDEPAATGAAYVKGDHAWLTFAATLEAHRRKGAQGALLARRLKEAAARGARVAVTETGERLPDKPSNSYRNILRAGFKEAYLRQNYLSPLRPTRESAGA